MAATEVIQIKDLEKSDLVLDRLDNVHPAFNDTRADVALCSREEIVFRVHSLILQLASGWFRALLTLHNVYLPTKPLQALKLYTWWSRRRSSQGC